MKNVNAEFVQKLQELNAGIDGMVRQRETVIAYVKGLRIWGTDEAKQIATDILYLIGEK